MIGDRLLILKRHYNYANNIFEKIDLNKRQIILIGACSGVGKTETADVLQELLFNKSKQSLVLSLDDFYNTLPIIRNYNRKKLGIDSVGTNEIDFEELKRICNDFKKQKPIKFRRVHKYASVVEHNVLDTDEISYLIIEGLYANYLRKLGYGDLSIYLEGTPKQTLEFRKKRNKENENDTFRKQIVKKEFHVICQLKKYADIILEFINER